MLGKAAAGLAALGLIGGVGTVAFHDGNATVKITDPKTGQSQSVALPMDNSKSYSCSDSTNTELRARAVTIGRIKLTDQNVRQELRGIQRRVRTGASHYDRQTVNRYNRLVRREHRLFRAFNDEAAAYNATLASDCDLVRS